MALAEGIESLYKSHHLEGNQIGNSGCMQLIRPSWPSLSYLNITKCSIGDEGCAYLIRNQWHKIEALILGPINKIQDK